MNLIKRIRKYIRNKQNSKLFDKLESSIINFIYLKLSVCDIESSPYETTIKFNGLYEKKDIKIKLIIKPNVNILQIEYKNKKLFKKYSKVDYHYFKMFLIEMEVNIFFKSNNNDNSNKSSNNSSNPKSEKLEKLNKTLESYQNQYNEILKWEKLNGKNHQDRLMVTSMIENVKDKIEKISNKTI